MMNDKCKSGVWESLLKHLHQDADRRSIDQQYSDSRSSTCRRRFEVQSKDAVFNDAQSGLREGLLSAMRQIRFPSIGNVLDAMDGKRICHIALNKPSLSPDCAMRQIRFPSIASRTLPIKKPRPETAYAA